MAQEYVPRCPASLGIEEKQKCSRIFTIDFGRVEECDLVLKTPDEETPT